MIFGLISTFLLIVPPAQDVRPSGGVLIPEQACYDVRHYRLTLEVFPEQQSLEGAVTITAAMLEATQKIVVDLDGHLEVRGVTVDDRDSKYEFDKGRIEITLPVPAVAGSQVAIRVAYGGKPRVAPRPPWDGGLTWSKTKDGRPWIATSCQIQGADLWWPCKDHPSDKPEKMDLEITVPEELVCASNGVLVSDEKTGNGKRVFHWHVKNPISNYNVALNIAPYEVLESSWTSVAGDDVPVYFWTLPESVEKAKKVLPEFIDHLRFFEELCGPYAFRNEKYGIAETPHLGMEHQTIIAYGNQFRGIDEGYDWLHHHEAAHEWWANLVTCRDWKDMWVHEGFGTYMQSLYMERIRGEEGYRKEMAKQRRGIRNRKPVAPRDVQDSTQIYSGHDIYNKGSWILHTLRWQMGDELFFRALRRFAYPSPEREKVTDGSQVRWVDTNDFKELVEELTKRDMGWFFDLYLHQSLLPELESKRDGDLLELWWQTPDELPFPMAVPVRINGAIQRIEISTGKARVELPPGAQVEIDPDKWLLKR